MLKTEGEKALTIVQEFCDEQKYGEVIFKIECGNIVRIVTSESIKI